MEDIQDKLEDTNWEITEAVNRRRRVRVMVFNATCCGRVLVEGTGIPGENHRHFSSNW